MVNGCMTDKRLRLLAATLLHSLPQRLTSHSPWECFEMSVPRDAPHGAGTLDPPPLRRAAPVVRDRRRVGDRDDLHAAGLQRADRHLAPRAGALDEHVNLSQTVLGGAAGGLLGRHLRGVRGALAGAL